MIRPDPTLLADKRPLSAVLSDLAPPETELDEAARLAVFDKILAGLMAVVGADGKPDPEFRILLCDMAAGHLRIGVKNGQARLKRALDEWQQHLASIEAKAAADAEADRQRTQAAALRQRPPLDRFNDLVATAVDGWDHLLLTSAPAPKALDAAQRLRLCDDLIKVLLPMPDQELRGLHAKQLADHLDLKPKDVADRLKRAQLALNTPAGQAVGGDIKDGGFHAALVGALRRYLAARAIMPDAVNGWLDVHGKPVGVKTRKLVNDFHFVHASYFESLPRDRIDITLAGLTQEARDKRRREIVGRICGRPSTLAGAAELRRWLIATTRRDDPIDFAVMQHFMWQVKRLNSGKPVAWDLMPILTSYKAKINQGAGKSTAIRRLCEPWSELMLNITAQMLVDERSTELLADYAIGFWGEISGGNKAEITAVKQTLTSVQKSHRELGGHDHSSVVRRMAFIGDSNQSVKDIITDTTGMRRFYEIDVMGVADYDEVNAVDPFLMWDAISEDDAPPYDTVAETIRDRQKDLISQDTFDHFLTWSEQLGWPKTTILIEGAPYDNGQPPLELIPAYDSLKDADGQARGYSLEQLTTLFKQYVRQKGGVVRDTAWVARRLREAGWATHRPRTTAGKKRPICWLKPEQPIDPDDQAQTADAPTVRASIATFAGKPTASEDLYAQATQASAEPTTTATATADREPGADEDEGPFSHRQEPADGPVI